VWCRARRVENKEPPHRRLSGSPEGGQARGSDNRSAPSGRPRMAPAGGLEAGLKRSDDRRPDGGLIRNIEHSAGSS
jgi:hypothetical protein